MESTYKKGDTVYMDRGDKMRKLVVAKVIDNPFLPIYQYSFEPPNDGFACGEQSIRAFPDDEDTPISECAQKDVDGRIATRTNTICNAVGGEVRWDDWGLGETAGNLFFRPNFEFVDWIKDHANGRMIVDVGCGQGHLVRMLKHQGAKAMGLEPHFDYMASVAYRLTKQGVSIDVNEVLPMTVQQAKGLIKTMGENNRAMLVFARPCHNNFVEEGIDNMPKGMEALYITVPENLNRYNDLGIYKKKAKLLKHKGQSEDNEIVYSVIQ